MKNNNSKKSIKENIISKIKRGEIKAKPKIYFIVKTLFNIGIVLTFFLFLLYIGSLIIFILRVNNFLAISGLGIKGIKTVIFYFPWYLLILSLFLIIVFEFFGKKFSLIYRRPLLYSLIAIMIMTTIGSFFIERSSFHHSFSRIAKERQIPFMGRMYKNMEQIDFENVYFGEILEKEENLWKMKDENGETISLIITEKTKNFKIKNRIKEGDSVIIIGEKREDNLIEVLGFRKNFNRIKKNEI